MRKFMKKKLVLGAMAAVLVAITAFGLLTRQKPGPEADKPKDQTAKTDNGNSTEQDNSQQYANESDLVGPKGNVPDSAPSEKGFPLFAIPVPGVLSRSGQPTLDDFKWLKEKGWKSVVDFREDGEKGNQYAVDSKLPRFNDLGLNFLSIPIKDGGLPSREQADKFLKFVIDPMNQPAHIHCAAGIGRTGIATALYRYSVQGWPMDKAIEEASLFDKSMKKSRQDWLRKWSEDNAPGSYAK
jgi:protein tyrosine phosphatase (PTP) superfamily phosphohydrolase (DUF442 family)